MNVSKVKKDNKVVTTLSNELHDYVKTVSEEVEGNMSYAVRKIIKQHMELNKEKL